MIGSPQDTGIGAKKELTATWALVELTVSLNSSDPKLRELHQAANDIWAAQGVTLDRAPVGIRAYIPAANDRRQVNHGDIIDLIGRRSGEAVEHDEAGEDELEGDDAIALHPGLDDVIQDSDEDSEDLGPYDVTKEVQGWTKPYD